MLAFANIRLSIVDELAAPNMLLQYSLHEPRCGHADIKAFMTDFRAAFPDLSFGGAADLIAEGDYVVGRWRHAQRAGILRLPGRGVAVCDGSQDALHRNDSAAS